MGFFISFFGLKENIYDYKSPGELRMAYARTQGRVVADDLVKRGTNFWE